ncbi:MAG TPA: hypothetical protein VK897_10425 [Anaerolineales bacterium]|nr:hypothetical protein [Anaerolineales bacterium]
MGIIAPKKLKAGSKIFVAFFLIIFSPILILPVLLYFLWGAILYIAIWLTQRKPFVIFVYSDSPTWKEYIEKEIVPHIQNRAVILNWSERRHWKDSLAVLAFHYFGGYRNFNPIGMVFRPFRFVKTYRLFEAFKRGNVKRVEEIKREFFALVEA